MKRKIYIHPGYPKTGTTALQTYFFSKICLDNKWEYFGKKYDINGKIIKNERLQYFIWLLRTKDEIYFINNKQSIISDTLGPGNSTVILSLETIISDCMRTNKVNTEVISNNIFSRIRKLSILFNEDNGFIPFIILIIRKQEELIPSWYAQAYAEEFRFIKSLNTFDHFVDNLNKKTQYVNIFSPLYFDTVIKEYESIFGKKKLLILDYEDMVFNINDFKKKILDFMNLELNHYKINFSNVRKENNTWKTKSFSIVRLNSKLQKKIKARFSLLKFIYKIILYINNKVNFRYKRIVVTSENKEKIQQYFVRSNNFLKDNYNIFKN